MRAMKYECVVVQSEVDVGSVVCYSKGWVGEVMVRSNVVDGLYTRLPLDWKFPAQRSCPHSGERCFGNKSSLVLVWIRRKTYAIARDSLESLQRLSPSGLFVLDGKDLVCTVLYQQTNE